MGYAADQHSGRLALLRGELVETHDDGEFQRVTATGLAGQRFSKVGRNLPFGFTGHAPPGSIGQFLQIGGRPDMTWALGFEHPGHRQKNLGVGHTAIYNAHGDVISLVEQKVRYVSALHEFVGDIAITGNITMTGNFTQSGVHVDSNGPHTA